MDADLTHVRQLIYSSATEEEKVALREKWLGPDKTGVVLKRSEKVNLVTDSFFLELIEDEKDAIEATAKTAREATESARMTRVKSDEKELSRKFAKLISGNIARVLNGELVFQLPNSEYFYSVTVDNGHFLLSINNAPVERFQENGDLIRSLAKLLARDPKPKPTVAPVTAISAEQRLRGVIGRYIAALDELKASQ